MKFNLNNKQTQIVSRKGLTSFQTEPNVSN